MILPALSVLTLALLAPVQTAPAAPDSIPAEAAREDILQLADLLERVHPDPYAGFGGRVAYRRALQSLLDGVPDGWLEIGDLRMRLAAFLGDMGDGHTGIQQLSAGSGEVERRYLPLRFSTSADAIVVSDALPSFGDLVGARVESVEGRPVEQLAREARIFFPSENPQGSRRQLARSLAGVHLVSSLLPEVADSLHLTVTRPGGDGPEPLTLAYVLSVEERRAGPWPMQQVERVSVEKGPFSHRMIAGEGVGYLRLRAMWSREAFESMRASGRTDIPRWLTYAWENFMDGEPPPEEAEAIATFPSLIDEADELLRVMEEHGTRRLIVDLRNNGGGFSVVGEPLLYQLFGEAYLEAPSPVQFATRVSEEILAIQGTTLEELSEGEGRDVRMGDFLVNPPGGRPPPPQSLDDFLRRHRDNGFSRVDVLAATRSQPGLKVVVLTDAATFSAAFELAYQLRRMGAALVGVPPSQSPTAFTDSTPYELINSGLKGSMSRTAVVYPGIPSEAGAVVMDVPLTWTRWVQAGMHPDAAVDLALDLLAVPPR